MDNDLDLVYKRLFLETGTSRNIFSFVSGAEQTGTSWCALSIAHALNIEKNKVLLVDANGNFSNIGSSLKLDTPLYLENYTQGKKTLNQLVTAYKNKNFNILTASTGSNYLLNQQQGRVQIFAEDLNILAQGYDYTIIDLGTEVNKKNLSLCRISNDIIIVCSEKSTDLVHTLETLKFIKKMGVCANYNLIINKVVSFEAGYKIYKELSKAADRSGMDIPKLLGIVRIDTRIRDTIRNKELLLTRYPTSEAAIDICGIAKEIQSEDRL